ncbi:hypothetical protein VIGAN_04397300, partial [Vigna angularis var. angularis]
HESPFRPQTLTLIRPLFLFKLSIHTLFLCFFLASDRTLRLGVRSHSSACSRRYLTIFCLLCFDFEGYDVENYLFYERMENCSFVITKLPMDPAEPLTITHFLSFFSFFECLVGSRI